jgi:hypothetical protein
MKRGERDIIDAGSSEIERTSARATPFTFFLVYGVGIGARGSVRS